MSGVLTIEQRGDSPFRRWVVLNSFGWFWDDKLHVFVEDGGTFDWSRLQEISPEEGQ